MEQPQVFLSLYGISWNVVSAPQESICPFFPVVVLAGALLAQCISLLDKGIHPTLISEALFKASDKAIEVRDGWIMWTLETQNGSGIARILTWIFAWVSDPHQHGHPC